MGKQDMRHLNYLNTVTANDVTQIMSKEASYQGSWKRRGGIGAFMMLARKWDRIEPMVQDGFGYDLFEALNQPGAGMDGTVLAEIRDLRRYLTLVEAEHLSRTGQPNPVKPPTVEDRPFAPHSPAAIAASDAPQMDQVARVKLLEETIQDLGEQLYNKSLALASEEGIARKNAEALGRLSVLLDQVRAFLKPNATLHEKTRMLIEEIDRAIGVHEDETGDPT